MDILILFIEFFKIGLFTFGGGYAMIPLMKQSVLNHAWLLEEEFYSFLGICEATPGPIAVNMATYIGSDVGGILGSVCATLGVVLPSFIIILLVATVLTRLIKNRYFVAFLDGVKPIAIGLILATGVTLVIKAIGVATGFTVGLDIASIVLLGVLGTIYAIPTYVLKKKLNNVLFILLAAILGIVVCVLI